MTAALDKLDERWMERWGTLHDQMKKDASANRNEIRKLRDAQTRGTGATETLTKLTKVRFDSVEANQRTIMKTQDDQMQALQATQKAVIDDINKKLEATLNHMSTDMAPGRGPAHRDPTTYAQKAAQPPRNDTEPPQPIPKYTMMAKRVSQSRPPTTLTNGALSRVYVKDWRSEPVGVVKKALRNDIAEWIQKKRLRKERWSQKRYGHT